MLRAIAATVREDEGEGWFAGAINAAVKRLNPAAIARV